MVEILSMAGWLFLLTNGPIVFFLIRFAEKVGNPEFDEKVFKKTIWRNKNGNSKKN